MLSLMLSLYGFSTYPRASENEVAAVPELGDRMTYSTPGSTENEFAGIQGGVEAVQRANDDKYCAGLIWPTKGELCPAGTKPITDVRSCMDAVHQCYVPAKHVPQKPMQPKLYVTERKTSSPPGCYVWMGGCELSGATGGCSAYFNPETVRGGPEALSAPVCRYLEPQERMVELLQPGSTENEFAGIQGGVEAVQRANDDKYCAGLIWLTKGQVCPAGTKPITDVRSCTDAVHQCYGTLPGEKPMQPKLYVTERQTSYPPGCYVWRGGCELSGATGGCSAYFNPETVRGVAESKSAPVCRYLEPQERMVELLEQLVNLQHVHDDVPPSTGPQATDPAPIYGCMSPQSPYYNSKATQDDGSCGPGEFCSCSDPVYAYDPNGYRTCSCDESTGPPATDPPATDPPIRIFKTKAELVAAINSGKSGWSDMATWDVSGITDFSGAFNYWDPNRQDDGWDGTVGEIPIQDWDVSNGENFYQMFAGAADFNADVSAWDVSKGKNFDEMFYGAKVFDNDLGDWEPSEGTSFENMLKNADACVDDINFNCGAWVKVWRGRICPEKLGANCGD
jgi:hypothetical protein